MMLDESSERCAGDQVGQLFFGFGLCPKKTVGECNTQSRILILVLFGNIFLHSTYLLLKTIQNAAQGQPPA